MDQFLTSLSLLLVSQSSPRLALLLTEDKDLFLGLWHLYCFVTTRARLSHVNAKICEIWDAILVAMPKESAGMF
jgi:hypothetical protein